MGYCVRRPGFGWKLGLVPTTVTISPDTALVFNALAVTVRLTATVRDQHDAIMSGVPVAWASTDTSVATVTPAGLLTSVGNGTATVSASAGSASGNATVTVAQEVAAVAVSRGGGPCQHDRRRTGTVAGFGPEPYHHPIAGTRGLLAGGSRRIFTGAVS